MLLPCHDGPRFVESYQPQVWGPPSPFLLAVWPVRIHFFPKLVEESEVKTSNSSNHRFLHLFPPFSPKISSQIPSSPSLFHQFFPNPQPNPPNPHPIPSHPPSPPGSASAPAAPSASRPRPPRGAAAPRRRPALAAWRISTCGGFEGSLRLCQGKLVHFIHFITVDIMVISEGMQIWINMDLLFLMIRTGK